LTLVDRHVGRRVRGKRRALGLVEDHGAAVLGVDRSVIDAYEHGTLRVPPDHLIKLSQMFEVPLAYFFPASPCADI